VVGPPLIEAHLPHTLHPIFLRLGRPYNCQEIEGRVELMVSLIVRFQTISPDGWATCGAKVAVHRHIGAWRSFRRYCHVLVVEPDKVWALGLGSTYRTLSHRAMPLCKVNLTHWGWSETQPASLFRCIQCCIMQYVGTHML
jgi:hypothetical protein